MPAVSRRPNAGIEVRQAVDIDGATKKLSVLAEQLRIVSGVSPMFGIVSGQLV